MFAFHNLLWMHNHPINNYSKQNSYHVCFFSSITQIEWFAAIASNVTYYLVGIGKCWCACWEIQSLSEWDSDPTKEQSQDEIKGNVGKLFLYQTAVSRSVYNVTLCYGLLYVKHGFLFLWCIFACSSWNPHLPKMSKISREVTYQ